MKKNILLLMGIASAFLSKAQDTIVVELSGASAPNSLNILFEDNSQDAFFVPDASQPGNLWQIGQPLKTNFTAAYSGNRALLTDTVNPYPINNTSSFTMTIKHRDIGWAGVEFLHKIDSDNGADGGTIEISADSGATWYSLADHPLDVAMWWQSDVYDIADTVTALGKPGVSGSTGWQHGSITVYGPSFGPNPWLFLLKFTFASDGIASSPKDGWMIDDFFVYAQMEGISEQQVSHAVSMYPNPASTVISYTISEQSHAPVTVALYNSFAEKISETTVTGNGSLDVSGLSRGIYFATFKSNTIYETKKILVQQ